MTRCSRRWVVVAKVLPPPFRDFPPSWFLRQILLPNMLSGLLTKTVLSCCRTIDLGPRCPARSVHIDLVARLEDLSLDLNSYGAYVLHAQPVPVASRFVGVKPRRWVGGWKYYRKVSVCGAGGKANGERERVQHRTTRDQGNLLNGI